MGRIRRRPSHILKRHRDERDGGEKAQPQKQGPLPYCKRHQFCTANNPSGISENLMSQLWIPTWIPFASELKWTDLTAWEGGEKFIFSITIISIYSLTNHVSLVSGLDSIGIRSSHIPLEESDTYENKQIKRGWGEGERGYSTRHRIVCGWKRL